MTVDMIQKTSSIFTISNEASKVRFNNQFYNTKQLTLLKDSSSKGYGFTVSGYCPCHVESINDDSVACRMGLQKDDLIMKINNINCCRATLKTVTNLIKNTCEEMTITVYRLSNPKVKNSSKCAIKQEKKSKKTSYFGKLFKPSIKWLSCAAPLSVNKIESCSSVQHHNQTLDQTYYTKSDISKETTSSSQICADTGYETLSRHDDSNDYTIETVTNTTNSYSDCDLSCRSCKTSPKYANYEEIFNEEKTQLIGELIEMEANFVSYLSMAVANMSRPLRSFFMQQQDYFVLFQNLEKILIISENFLRSMDKWSALDLYTRIGQLYTQKLNLFREAFTSYTKGHATSKCLLNDLKSHSKQFRLFLNETQSGNMTLNNLIDLPLIHINETLNYFKQIRRFTCESKRNPSEAPHIDSVIFELRKILTNSQISLESLQQDNFIDIDREDSNDETRFTQDDSFFMSTTISDDTLTFLNKPVNGKSKHSLFTSSDESASDLFYSTNSN